MLSAFNSNNYLNISCIIIIRSNNQKEVAALTVITYPQSFPSFLFDPDLPVWFWGYKMND